MKVKSLVLDVVRRAEELLIQDGYTVTWKLNLLFGSLTSALSKMMAELLCPN